MSVALPHCRQTRRSLCSRLIKVEHSSFQVFTHQFFEGNFKRSSASPLWKECYPELSLE